MQLGNDFQGKKCARCRHAIDRDPAFEDALWYHRVCLEQGKKELQHANEIVARLASRRVILRIPHDIPPLSGDVS